MNEDTRWPIAVGDEVMLWEGGRGSRVARIQAIGPKLIHVVHGSRVTKFLRTTRRRQDGHSGSFETLPQRADREANDAARASLRKWGVSVEHSSRWTTEDLVLLEKLVGALKIPLNEEK